MRNYKKKTSKLRVITVVRKACICDVLRVIYSIQCNMYSINNCDKNSYIGSYILEKQDGRLNVELTDIERLFSKPI